MNPMTCSFTGHRALPEAKRAELYDLVMRAVSYAYDEGCRDFCVGGAVGFDTLAAKAVVRFRMDHPDARLLLLLPCMNQDEKWGEAERAVYAYLLSVADEVEYVSKEYTSTCMKKRNEALANRADILIAYVGHDRSGASQTCRMARSLGKRIYNLYPTLFRETGINSEL